MTRKILIAFLLTTIPSCTTGSDDLEVVDASPKIVDVFDESVPTSDDEQSLITPIEILTDCELPPAQGGCFGPVTPVYGPSPGPYSGYSHSTCSGPPDGRCWDKNIGGTIYKSTIEVGDFVPRFNEAFEIPTLSQDGTQWFFPGINESILTAKLSIPNGCRLKWVTFEGFTFPNWVGMNYRVRRDIGGAEINGYTQQNYGGWSPYSFSLASSHLATTVGDDATLEIGSHSNGWSVKRGDYFYNCPGF